MGGAHACIQEILHCNRVPPIRSSYLTVRAGAKAVLLFCFVLVLLLKVKREMDEYQYIYIKIMPISQSRRIGKAISALSINLTCYLGNTGHVW